MEVHEGIPGDFLKNKRRKVRGKGDFFLSRNVHPVSDT